jgi:arylformamidase
MTSNDPRLNWAALSQAERDAAYDNNKAVANSPALIAVRNEASAKFRAAHTAALDIPYGKRERTKIDLYPARDKAAPCLVFIHGGYWQRNSRDVFAMLVEGMAAHGWSVAIPGYSLAPEASLTEIAAEIGAALDWLAKEGGHHGIGGPIVLSGWSAGAHLAALALGHPAVVAGIAVSGIFELCPLRDTYINEKLKLTDEEAAMLSPLRLPVVQKPLVIAYGSREVPALVNDSRALHARRSDAHAPGALVPIAGADHFTILYELRSPTGVLVRQARALVP